MLNVRRGVISDNAEVDLNQIELVSNIDTDNLISKYKLLINEKNNCLEF